MDSSMFLEKCPTCGSKIYYQDGEPLVKCTSCGNTHLVADFLNEQIRRDKLRKDNQQKTEELEIARREKAEADKRLFHTITALGNIETSQLEHKALLEQLNEGQNQNQAQVNSLIKLAEELQNKQNESRDFVSILYNRVIEGQENAENAINALQYTIKQLAENKTDEIVEYLKLDSKEKKDLLVDLQIWMQSAHQEDNIRLGNIQKVCEELIKDNALQEAYIEQLRTDSQKIQKTVEGFEKHWQESELRKMVQCFRQAEIYQFERKFDKAEEYYRQVLIAGGKDPEVYWRIVLCHYCIEYQVDNEGNRIPSILYPDLRAPEQIEDRRELENSYQTEEQKQYYNDQLEVIDGYLNDYRRFCKSVQYDVFMSVKQKDDGHPTEDCAKAYRLYNYLTNELGLKVFNSEVTKPEFGEKFEPYILAALLSSKVMIVVGSCREYMEAQWVRNEWSRYLWLQKNEEIERKLICYLVNGMKPNQMPNELLPIQCIEENDLDNKDALKWALEKVFGKLPKGKVAQKSESSEMTIPVEELIVQWETCLANKKYDTIKEQYNRMVQQGKYLNNAQIHLMSICADYKVPSVEKLPRNVLDLLDNRKFSLADKYAKSEEDRILIDNLKKKSIEEKKKRQAEKVNKAYAVFSALSAAVIVFIMVALYYVEPYADGMKRDVHIEAILLSGATVILFLSILLFRLIHRLSTQKSIDAGRETRTIGAIHLCVCLFVLIGVLFTGDNAWDGWILGRWVHYYQYYNAHLIEIYTLAGSVFISAIAAILTVIQKEKAEQID